MMRRCHHATRSKLQRQPNGHPRGFLLVAVLFCLLIAGLTLVSLSQRSIALTTEAALRIDRLQQRWSVQSTQNLLLPRVGEIFEVRDELLAETKVSMPWPGEISFALILNGQPVTVVLADEAAKTNLNYLHSVRPTSTKKLLRQFTGPQFQEAIRLRPLPIKPLTTEEIEDGVVPRIFASWSQVFDLTQFPPGSDSVGTLSKSITFWGPGRLNVSRCNSELAFNLCGELTSKKAAQEILEEWWKDPRRELRRVIQTSGGLSSEQVLELQQALSNTSSCYSTRIQCQTSHSSLRRFAVVETDDEGLLRTTEFQF